MRPACSPIVSNRKPISAFFHERLRAADVLVHGRNSGEGDQRRGSARRRIILTRLVGGVTRDPENDRAVLWNPAAGSFESRLRASQHSLRPRRRDRRDRRVRPVSPELFDLSLESVTTARLPGGRPVFPGVPAISPDETSRKSRSETRHHAGSRPVGRPYAHHLEALTSCPSTGFSTSATRKIRAAAIGQKIA